MDHDRLSKLPLHKQLELHKTRAAIADVNREQAIDLIIELMYQRMLVEEQFKIMILTGESLK